MIGVEDTHLYAQPHGGLNSLKPQEALTALLAGPLCSHYLGNGGAPARPTRAGLLRAATSHPTAHADDLGADLPSDKALITACLIELDYDEHVIAEAIDNANLTAQLVFSLAALCPAYIADMARELDALPPEYDGLYFRADQLWDALLGKNGQKVPKCRKAKLLPRTQDADVS